MWGACTLTKKKNFFLTKEREEKVKLENPLLKLKGEGGNDKARGTTGKPNWESFAPREKTISNDQAAFCSPDPAQEGPEPWARLHTLITLWGLGRLEPRTHPNPKSQHFGLCIASQSS